MEKMKNFTPKIVSISYSFGLTKEIIREIIASDLSMKKEPLHKILKRRKEIKSIKYPHGIRRNSIEITLYTDSISNPLRNQKYWEEIALEINQHIEEE